MTTPGETPETVPVVRRGPDPADSVVWEPSDRWVRGTKGDVTVVDSHRAVLLWEPGRPVPLYAFPVEDVRMDLLRRFERPASRRHGGATVYYDLVIGDEIVRTAAWECPGGSWPDTCASPGSDTRCSTTGTRRTRRSSCILVIPTSAWTRCPALATSRSRSRARSSRTRGRRCCCSRRAFRSLLLSARGRTPRTLHPDRHAHPLPVQGCGHRVLVMGGRRRCAARHRLELPGSAAGRRCHQGPGGVLRRVRRRHRRRGTADAARHRLRPPVGDICPVRLSGGGRDRSTGRCAAGQEKGAPGAGDALSTPMACAEVRKRIPGNPQSLPKPRRASAGGARG